MSANFSSTEFQAFLHAALLEIVHAEPARIALGAQEDPQFIGWGSTLISMPTTMVSLGLLVDRAARGGRKPNREAQARSAVDWNDWRRKSSETN